MSPLDSESGGGRDSFRPAWWCRGAHAQTIWGSLLRPAHPVARHRQRWELPDGDFLDVDHVAGASGTPILIVLHGLEGSTRSRPVAGLLAAAERRGWRALGINFRSCSGTPNRLRRSYHGGDTADLAWIIHRTISEHPDSPILGVGLSLGGNVLLKYLGEQGDALPPAVRAAVAISTPFELAESVRALDQGFSWVYMARMVRRLKHKTRAKLTQYPDLVDRRALAAVRTIAEFDEVVTAPVHGFRSAADYWRASSSAAFLPKIRRPTLLINAADDPFFPEDALPRAAVSANRFLTAEFTDHGGHLGFLTGPWPGWPACWAEQRALQFLAPYAENLCDNATWPSGTV